MTASIWNPTQTFIPDVDAQLSVAYDKVIATGGQTLIPIANFAYTLGTNSVMVLQNGDLLVPGIDFTETSTSSITLTVPATVGDKISLIGFTAIDATVIVPADGSITSAKLSPALVISVSKGGTGATSAAAALTALGAMPKAGGSFTGAVTLAGDAAAALQPTTLQQVQALLLGASESAVWDFGSRQLDAGASFFFTQP